MVGCPVSLEVERRDSAQNVSSSHPRPGSSRGFTVNLSMSLLFCETLDKRREEGSEWPISE